MKVKIKPEYKKAEKQYNELTKEEREKKVFISVVDLLEGKTYNVEEIEPKHKWLRIIDESGDDYIYPPEMFVIVEN